MPGPVALRSLRFSSALWNLLMWACGLGWFCVIYHFTTVQDPLFVCAKWAMWQVWWNSEVTIHKRLLLNCILNKSKARFFTTQGKENAVWEDRRFCIDYKLCHKILSSLLSEKKGMAFGRSEFLKFLWLSFPQKR